MDPDGEYSQRTACFACCAPPGGTPLHRLNLSSLHRFVSVELNDMLVLISMSFASYGEPSPFSSGILLGFDPSFASFSFGLGMF